MLRITQAGVLPNTNSLAWLNASSNWPAAGGLIAGGDTVLLDGTFTNQFTPHSGAAGNRVSVVATNAIFIKPTWGSASGNASAIPSESPVYASAGENLSDLLLQGFNIQCSSNGAGKVFTNHFFAAYLQPKRNVELSGWFLTNLTYYVGATNWVTNEPYWSQQLHCLTNSDGSINYTNLHGWADTVNCIPGPGDSSVTPPITWKWPASAVTGIEIVGGGHNGMTNILVHNATIDQCINGIVVALDVSGTGTNNSRHDGVQVYSNTITHGNWGIGWLAGACGDTLGIDAYNCGIWANQIRWLTNFNTANSPAGINANNPNHGDFIIAAHSSPKGTNYGMQIRRNLLGPQGGTLVSGMIYVDITCNANCADTWLVDNNILDYSSPGDQYPIVNLNGSKVQFRHNTIVGKTATTDDTQYNKGYPTNSTGTALVLSSESTGAQSAALTNNLFYNIGIAVAGLTHVRAGDPPKADGNFFDYFFYPDLTSPQQETMGGDFQTLFGYVPGVGSVGGLSDWKSLGNDSTATLLTNQLIVNLTTYALTVTNLVGRTVPGVTEDFYGNARTNYFPGAIQGVGSAAPVEPTPPESGGGPVYRYLRIRK